MINSVIVVFRYIATLPTGLYKPCLEKDNSQRAPKQIKEKKNPQTGVPYIPYTQGCGAHSTLPHFTPPFQPIASSLRINTRFPVGSLMRDPAYHLYIFVVIDPKCSRAGGRRISGLRKSI